MKIGIIGYGFVGEAISKAFIDEVEIFKVDPKLKTTIEDLKKFNPETIFICVPTPMNSDGIQDISILEQVVLDIKNHDLDSLVILKSTVHPGNIDDIKRIFPSFVYNPEFLREKHAYDDFINSNLIVFGGNKKSCKEIANIYSKYTKCLSKDYIYTDVITASLIKYAINTFLASKVIFFNEFYDLFKAVNTDESWTNFINYLSRDTRLGNSHMNVPGHDGRFGFGGACLPKDAYAITKYADQLNVEMSMIKHAINKNIKIRTSYEDVTDREEQQNIKYNSEEVKK